MIKCVEEAEEGYDLELPRRKCASRIITFLKVK